MALLTWKTGTTMTHVPYRGSAPAVADLIASNLQLAIPTMAAVLTILAVITVVATVAPTLRIVRIDPARTLREE